MIYHYLLNTDLRPRQTCHSKDGGSAYSIGVGELGWQYWTGLKSHGTVTDWCTGREWPVNCMTVISAWWRSNMPFQRLSGRLNYYISRWRQEVSQFGDRRVWREDAVEKNSIRRKGPWGPPIDFGDRRVWRQDVIEKASNQQKGGPLSFRWSSSGERERNSDGQWSGEVNMLQFFRPLTPSHAQPFQIKWEVYFSKKELCRSSLLYRCYENTTCWIIFFPYFIFILLTVLIL